MSFHCIICSNHTCRCAGLIVVIVIGVANLIDCDQADHKFHRVSNKRSWVKHEIEGYKLGECGKYEWPQVNRTRALQSSNNRSSQDSTEIRFANKRLTHGQVTKLKQFPSYVRIEFFNSSTPDLISVCGGTVVAIDLIITAAHCIKRTHNTAKVIAGIIRTNYDSDGESTGQQQIYVRNICFHKDYVPADIGQALKSMRDIAVLQLEEKLQFNDAVQPACLPLDPTPTNPQLYTIGMGQTARNHPSESLNYVAVVDDPLCESIYDTGWDSCYSPTPTGEICYGDSGSGLMNIDENRQYLVGVTSSNIVEECEQNRQTPGIYADIYKERFEVKRMLNYCYEKMEST